MENKLNNTLETESSKGSKKWPLITLIVILLAIICAGLVIFAMNSKEESVETEVYRFVNGNSVICSQNIQTYQIDCEDLSTGQTRSTDIPDQFKNSGIKPSHDGTKLLLEQAVDDEKTTFIVTDTNFTNPQTVTMSYDEENGTGNPYPNVMWGNNANTLIISKQVKEDNDADFLSAPLVVWSYDITTKESRRIFKTGEIDVQALKIIGVSDDYLFISQPIVKNWVAKDTDPPADALLAVRLDDGFVRTISIEQIVKIQNTNKYADGISISYDPVLSTFYFSGQNQTSDTSYQNYYAAAKLIDTNGLMIEEISRLTSQAQYYGITTSKGTLVADWSDESEGFSYSLVATPQEINELQDVSPDKDNTKLVLASLPLAE